MCIALRGFFTSTLSSVLVFALAASGSCGEEHEQLQAKLLKSPEQAKSILDDRLPLGTSQESVVNFLREYHIEHSEPSGGEIIAIVRSKQSFAQIVRSDMQIDFYFGARYQLRLIRTKRVFTGP